MIFRIPGLRQLVKASKLNVGIADDGTDGIVDFMGHARGYLPESRHFYRMNELCFSLLDLFRLFVNQNFQSLFLVFNTPHSLSIPLFFSIEPVEPAVVRPDP